MEASLSMYIPGTIVRYDAPFKKKVCENYGIPSSHPVLILNQSNIPDVAFQCMIVSSQIAHYYGYRLYLNTMDPTYKRMSVICTNHIYTIHKKYLRDILGFVPRDLMERVRKAYAWEIGLSNEMPEYYRNDETCVGWITAGQPNVPDMPNPFDLKEGGVEAGRRIAIASASRPFNETVEAIGNIIPQSRMVNGAIDPQVIHGMPIATRFRQEMEAAPSGEFEMEDGRRQEPDEDPVPPADAPAPASEEETAPRKRQTHKFPRVNWELFSRIENHVVPAYTKAPGMRDLMQKIPMRKQFDIFMRKHNGVDMHNMSFAPSRHVGDALIGAIIKRIEEDKTTIIDGAISGSMNWRMLADRFVPALRAMTIREIRQIHMGKDKYFEILALYGFSKADSYIGECELNDIIFEQLTDQQLEELGIPTGNV